MTAHLNQTENNPNPPPDERTPETHSVAHNHLAEFDNPDRPNHELGFSMSELLIAVAIIGILSVVLIGEVLNALEKARLAVCMANMVTIREEIWANCDGGMDFPDRDRLWNGIFRGVGPKGYWYALDNDDANKGHGNDLDGFDEQNPGNAPRKDDNIYFVLSCEHDHGLLADFVYLEDEGSPQIHQDGDTKPVWYKFYRKDGSGGGGGNNGGGNNGGGNNGGGNNGGGNNGGGNNGGGTKP